MARVGILTFAALAWIAPDALACSCLGLPLKYTFKRSPVVFVGEALAIDGVTVHFRVTEAFKGRVRANDEIEILNSDGLCGVTFVPRRRYVVHTYLAADNSLHTNICINTVGVDRDGGRMMLRLLRRRAWWWRSPMSSIRLRPIRDWFWRDS